MARQTAGDANVDQLPWAYRKGHGQPIGWKAQARCAASRETVTHLTEGGRPSIWQVEDHKTYRRDNGEAITGAELIQIACTLCAMCPAQWDCATFAVMVEEDFGVWAMPLAMLEWLRRRRDRMQIIERARHQGRPIQFAVADVRHPRRKRHP
jgi:hypothetical protein